MEATFISIHDLGDDARILYTSDSVVDILGYTPDELVNRSAWDFFPPEELPYARTFHSKKVSMDKAAVLAYCRVKDRDGRWLGCECCFSIVYDVMVVCTSIYRRDDGSRSRALAAPVVRRMFSSSPKDPRYHMLSHLSTKFSQPAKAQTHEPRAALFLNRFTRSLTIMYATTGVLDIIGIPSDAIRGRSFYHCVAANCLQDAVKCLENAKGNDSIAYLRFWFRDPRTEDPDHSSGEESDDEMTEAPPTEFSEDNEEGGVHLAGDSSDSPVSLQSAAAHSGASMDVDVDTGPNSRTSSDVSTHRADTHEAIFGQARGAESSASSLGQSPERGRWSPHRPNPAEPLELEAVISCTSDGLVVCLRRARPMIPRAAARPSQPAYPRGLYAAPWAHEPVLPPMEARAGAGYSTSFAPSLGPHGARHHDGLAHASAAGPHHNDFMNAIRDQAVFAWAITGINGALADFGRGNPVGESVPPTGFPVWANDPSRVDGQRSYTPWPNGVGNDLGNGV